MRLKIGHKKIPSLYGILYVINVFAFKSLFTLPGCLPGFAESGLSGLHELL